MAIHIKPVSFDVHGERIFGDLFLPRGTERPPVIVMAHGFAGTRRFCLPEYAWHFAAQDMAVLVFDYRRFGETEGRPRQRVDPQRHLDDYAAALAFVRQHPDVDGSRVALWGGSLNGGHALVTAARHPAKVCAVVALAPHVDGLFSAFTYPKKLVPGALWHAALNLVASALGQPAVRIPLATRHGVQALASTDAGSSSLEPVEEHWRYPVPARILMRTPRYRPVREAANIRCPVLLITSPTDSLIPVTAVMGTAERIPDCRLEITAGGHFDPYKGEGLRMMVKLQGAFLCEKLGVPELPRKPARKKQRPSARQPAAAGKTATRPGRVPATSVATQPNRSGLHVAVE